MHIIVFNTGLVLSRPNLVFMAPLQPRLQVLVIVMIATATCVGLSGSSAPHFSHHRLTPCFQLFTSPFGTCTFRRVLSYPLCLHLRCRSTMLQVLHSSWPCRIVIFLSLTYSLFTHRCFYRHTQNTHPGTMTALPSIFRS